MPLASTHPPFTVSSINFTDMQKTIAGKIASTIILNTFTDNKTQEINLSPPTLDLLLRMQNFGNDITDQDLQNIISRLKDLTENNALISEQLTNAGDNFCNFLSQKETFTNESNNRQQILDNTFTNFIKHYYSWNEQTPNDKQKIATAIYPFTAIEQTKNLFEIPKLLENISLLVEEGVMRPAGLVKIKAGLDQYVSQLTDDFNSHLKENYNQDSSNGGSNALSKTLLEFYFMENYIEYSNDFIERSIIPFLQQVERSEPYVSLADINALNIKNLSNIYISRNQAYQKHSNITEQRKLFLEIMMNKNVQKQIKLCHNFPPEFSDKKRLPLRISQSILRHLIENDYAIYPKTAKFTFTINNNQKFNFTFLKERYTTLTKLLSLYLSNPEEAFDLLGINKQEREIISKYINPQSNAQLHPLDRRKNRHFHSRLSPRAINKSKNNTNYFHRTAKELTRFLEDVRKLKSPHTKQNLTTAILRDIGLGSIKSNLKYLQIFDKERYESHILKAKRIAAFCINQPNFRNAYRQAIELDKQYNAGQISSTDIISGKKELFVGDIADYDKAKEFFSAYYSTKDGYQQYSVFRTMAIITQKQTAPISDTITTAFNHKIQPMLCFNSKTNQENVNASYIISQHTIVINDLEQNFTATTDDFINTLIHENQHACQSQSDQELAIYHDIEQIPYTQNSNIVSYRGDPTELDAFAIGELGATEIRKLFNAYEKNPTQTQTHIDRILQSENIKPNNSATTTLNKLTPKTSIESNIAVKQIINNTLNDR